MNFKEIEKEFEKKLRNFWTKIEFYSMMPTGEEKPFEVRVHKDENDSEGRPLIIPGYHSSDIVFDEIKKRVEYGSTVEIIVNKGRSSEERLIYER